MKRTRIFSLLALLIWAATGVKAENVAYQSASWDGLKVVYTDKTVSNPTTVSSSTTSMTNGNWYYVSSNVTVSSSIVVTGTVNLILKDGCKLTASAGIRVASGNTLNIYAQTAGTGAITATGSANYQAGIGGGASNESGGTVIIHGGVISATGKKFAAGIGASGSNNYTITNGGTVTIYGGTITASGGNWGAGIGGGADGNGADVTIYGGTVTATGYNKSGTQSNAYGIGMGAQDKTGRVNGSLTLSYRMRLYGGASSASSVINKSGNDYTRYRCMKAVRVSSASFFSDNADVAKWTLSATTVNVGASLTATYSGKKKVKSVEAWQKPDVRLTAITLNKTSASIAPGSTITLSVASYTPSNASIKSVTWSSDNTSVATVDASGVVYPIKAGTARIRATANDGSGVYAQCTVTVNYTDLSMVDCAGNFRGSRWTANCYMVHTAGNYCLPLVYGNAIKNGAANTAAYTGVSGSSTTATFPNHAGNAINAPWITKSTSGSGVDKGMGIAVTSAELLWQDAEGLVTAVGISGDYLTLTVGRNASSQQGNALIAVKNSSGTIVWSWHIWLTRQTFATSDLSTVSTSNYTYKVAPVNVGWVGNVTGLGYNTFYQWGRKDPFIPTKGDNIYNHTVYNISNQTVTTALNYAEGDNVTIADNIKNPTTHYYCSNSGKTMGPCITTYYNMWDAQQTSDGDNIQAATKKTVYDPCPPGFCVPTVGLYRYITNGGNSYSKYDQTNIGLNVTIASPALFFPSSGARGDVGAAASGVKEAGHYWSATPAYAQYGREMQFSGWTPSLNTRKRAWGCAIRAVAEE